MTARVTVEGTVLEALPHGLYRVGIEQQRQVVAHAPGGAGTELHPRADRRSRAAGTVAAGPDARPDYRGRQAALSDKEEGTV